MFNTQRVRRSFRARNEKLGYGILIPAILALTLVGCSAPKPKEYGSNWIPVNKFQTIPTEIPLAPAYTFYASPMDATLRNMLSRWASDNGLQLFYQIGSDFTLHQPVAAVRSNDIQVAVGELSAIYVSRGILISADSKQIVVRSVPISSPIAVGPR